MTPRSTTLATLLVAGAATSWGFWSLVLRPTGLPAIVTTTLIFAGMGLFALPFVHLEPIRPAWTRDAFVLLAANAVLDAINCVAFFGAMERTTVAIAVLTHYLAPIVVALAAPFIDGERRRHAVLCAAAGVVGLVLVLEPWRGDVDRSAWVGAALGTASAFAYAGNVFVVRRLAARIGAVRALSYHSLLAALLLAVVAGPTALALVDRDDAVRLALGAATLGAGAGWAFIHGLGVIGATRATTLAFLEPLVATVVGIVAWRERSGPFAWAGAGLVLAAGIAVVRAPVSRGSEPDGRRSASG